MVWACQPANRYIGQIYPAGNYGGVNGDIYIYIYIYIERERDPWKTGIAASESEHKAESGQATVDRFK